MDTIKLLLQDPLLFPLTIAVLTGGIVAALRKYKSEWWEQLPKRAQIAPALVVSAILTTAGEGAKIALADVGRELGPVLADWVVVCLMGWLGPIGGHHAGKRLKKSGSDPAMVVALVLFVVAPLLGGCAAFESTAKTLNDARLEMCDLLGEQHEAAIQAYAQRQGISLTEAFAVFRATCLIRAEQGEAEALGAVAPPPVGCQ